MRGNKRREGNKTKEDKSKEEDNMRKSKGLGNNKWSYRRKDYSRLKNNYNNSV